MWKSALSIWLVRDNHGVPVKVVITYGGKFMGTNIRIGLNVMHVWKILIVVWLITDYFLFACIIVMMWFECKYGLFGVVNYNID